MSCSIPTKRPHSNPSYTLDNYEECEVLEREDHQADCNLNLWLFGHSEVDIYAVLVLQKLGFQSWAIVESALREEVENAMKNLSSEDQDIQRERLSDRIRVINDVARK